MQTNQQSKHVTTATQYTRTKDSTIVLKMQRIGQNGSPKTSQQKSHCRYRTIKLAIVIDRAIPRGQRSILYRVIRDSCRSMGNLVSWALVQDAIVKKKKEMETARFVPLPFPMKPSPLIKDATREPDNPFPRARASFSIASVQDTQANQRVIGRVWTPLHVDFDFSKVDWKKKDKKVENSDSCTGKSVRNRDRNFLFEWREFDGTRLFFRYISFIFSLLLLL